VASAGAAGVCFIDADWPLVGGSFATADVAVLWPKKLPSAWSLSVRSRPTRSRRLTARSRARARRP